jgi:hypothetical protein
LSVSNDASREENPCNASVRDSMIQKSLKSTFMKRYEAWSRKKREMKGQNKEPKQGTSTENPPISKEEERRRRKRESAERSRFLKRAYIAKLQLINAKLNEKFAASRRHVFSVTTMPDKLPFSLAVPFVVQDSDASGAGGDGCDSPISGITLSSALEDTL